MRIDAGVSSSASEVFVFSVGNVEVGAWVTIFLGQSVIDDVHQIPLASQPHQKVVGFDVAVEEILGVNIFDARNQLVGKQQHRLQTELSIAIIEKIFE